MSRLDVLEKVILFPVGGEHEVLRYGSIYATSLLIEAVFSISSAL